MPFDYRADGNSPRSYRISTKRTPGAGVEPENYGFVMLK